MKKLHVVITVSSLGLVLGIVALESDRLTTPGPLHPSHAAVAELQGQAGCIACHGRAQRAMAQACTDCHVDIGIQINRSLSLHGKLAPNDAEDCMRCHREHNAGSVALVTTISFERAGIPDPDRYDHGDIDGFALAERHEELRCAACHRLAAVPTLKSGERRYLGLVQECVACHEDPHESSFGDDCARCHGQAHPFDQVALFEHDEAFPLSGGHDELACRVCHELDSRHSVETVLAAPMETRTCIDCHESPHRPEFLQAILLSEAPTEATSCELCHAAAHETFLQPPARMTEAMHAASGFPLDPPHDQLRCVQCHAASTEAPGATAPDSLDRFARRYPGRHADDCVSCHADPHQPTFGSDCQSCHGGAEPFAVAATFSHDPEFPLTGAHVGLACVDCHDDSAMHSVLELRAGEHPRRDCRACHQSNHRPEFLQHIGSTLAMDSDETCSSCHEPAKDAFSWPGASMTSDEHEATGFSLHEPHDGIDCIECHAELGRSQPEATDLMASRPPARTEQNCRACHDDPHQGQFDAVDERRSCLECHESTHFLPSTFDLEVHDAAGFELTGAHRAIACRSCHTMDGPVRRFVPLSGNCADCHEDVHRGRYLRDDRAADAGAATDCTRCHNTTGFTDVPATTDSHLLWSDYALRGAHAGASCAQCHPRRSEPDEFGMRIGRASPRCDSCHADPHAGQFAAGRDNDCSRCHRETATFAQFEFDHQRDSTFKLDEFHRTLDCNACHKPRRMESGATVVRYRPLGTECSDCHGLRQGG